MLDNLFAFMRETFAPFFEPFISGKILTEQSVQAARESFTAFQVASIALAVVVLIWGLCTRNANSKLVDKLADRLKMAEARERSFELKRRSRNAKRFAMLAAAAGNRRVSAAALQEARRSREELFRLKKKVRNLHRMQNGIVCATFFFTAMQIVLLLDGVIGFIPLSWAMIIAIVYGVSAILGFLASLFSWGLTANNMRLLSNKGYEVSRSGFTYMLLCAVSHLISALVALVNALILTMEACVAYGIVV